jgi:hypothetical protein
MSSLQLEFRAGILTLFAQREQKLAGNHQFWRRYLSRHATGSGVFAFPWRFDGLFERSFMHMDIVVLQPLVTLLFGILILILPRLLNYLIAIYLILVGLVGLFPHLFSSLH